VTEAKPCFNSNTHEIRYYAPGELARLYQFYPTPSSSDTEGLLLRAAVAIDCEMGTAMTGDSELIRLTAIDYLTGEVLINNIVDPDQYMMHLNTRYSGVTFPQLNEAKRKRTCLIGKAGAREALWRFVGPHTALVGHGVNNDLRALKWIHPTVVDSFLIEHKILQAKKAAIAAAEEAEAAAAAAAVAAAAAAATTALVEEPEHLLQKETSSPQTEVGPKKKKPKGSGDLSLKTLMKKYLDRDIQTQGNKGHDSFEDALAARDLVHWMVMRRLREKGLADANESGTLIDEGPQELI
jgi:RNA exonuclease 1